jgi:hypothetical protein
MDSCEFQNGEATMPDGSPLSYDGLPNTNFRLLFPKATWVNMFLQEFTVPEVSVTEVIRTTPYADINDIGEKMNYGDVTATFLVDKNLKNYREIFNWMRRMTNRGSHIGESDNPLLIVNGKEMIRFVEAWPMSLSGLSFVTNANDVTYITATAVFNLDYFEFVDEPFDVTNKGK